LRLQILDLKDREMQMTDDYDLNYHNHHDHLRSYRLPLQSKIYNRPSAI
jgi:hypothetical protein